ncbi:acyltransferase family protein [Bradyrhizobium sp. GCM10027634]|uniref:acyltransferase family protein n=1 Tax=unclassified Bradyrhizobium TaxID=2631580 RepID=UPI00188AE140|nr:MULTISPECIES: acyltransferase [unclassified Bradyrhizobium]MDN5005751.1 acyltransferase [Bradyrhizobium sp. WYCCWR 12677]
MQAARAIAALSVAYYHSYMSVRWVFPDAARHPIPFLTDWGHMGVDFFFAISGYVICLVVAKSSFTLRSFFIKRFFRLYPLYWTAMAIVAVMIWYGKHPDPVTPGQYFYSLTLLPQHGLPAYSVSWTLERELVFYALAAITIPLVGVLGLAAVLAALAWAGYTYHNPWSCHLVSTYQADFLAGVLVFMLSKYVRMVPLAARIMPPLAWFALVGGIVGLVSLWLVPAKLFPFATTICLGFMLLGMVHINVPWTHPSLHWLVKVGDASYSIYLLHGIILFYAAWLGLQINHLPDWLCEVWRFAALAVSCLVSTLTWRTIETPFIALGNRLADRSRIPAPGPAVAVSG